MDFKKINNWTGWLVTLIACTVYIMTSEAASSFWDCGEFISSAYKLQIPHPPGAPMFVLLGRVFIILFGDNPLTAAKAVNTMSALASGFTILFLFWTITHFAKRIVVKQTGTEPVGYQILAIMGAGIVGALAYTFSDSFWYSAVEGEVYALSSFFTALVFWAILKWEHKADQPGADKWIIFIFYMMGLSIGVHLLNILTIPAIVMVYYFRQYKPTITGGLVAFLVGVVITGFIQVVLIQFTIKWAGAFDVNFVNSMGLPFFSGFIFFFVLLAAILTWGIYYANKKGLYFLKLGVWSMIFMLLGYTTYITTMIRSNADPSVDMYNVDNPVTLVGYLGREQYGDWPILFGPDYVDKVDYIENGDQYVKAPTNYELAGKNYKRDWSSAPSSHLFPRMWDGENDRGQMDSYKAFAGVVDGEAPTLRDNIKYFTNYQFGFMYLRYFLWNFAGKQNDLQGFGNVRDGNFSTGISFIDNFFFGDQSKLPDTIKNNNKAHNSLFMLPFFLGLFGFLFQYQQNKKDFIVTGLLFFFTGLAIVLYLNQVSLQPRERDYAYVGSFYAFAIWIGLGVLQVIQWLTKVVNQNTASIIATVVCLLAVPALMAQQEWDDHDRSQKLLPRDLARNYLESCPPNAILFSFGDNDTYPLWYAQEVEGIRPDVRVVVNSLLGSDWYMRELRYKVNESNKFDVIFSEEQVSGNKLNVAYYNALPEYGETRYHNLDSVLRYVIGDPSGKYMASTTDGPVNIFPTHKFKVPVNKANALASGIAKPTDTMVDELLIDFNPNRQYLLKNELAMYAIIATSDFKRPICFTSTQELKELGIDKYVRQTGMSYQLVPVLNQTIDADVAYKNMMTKFSFGNAKNPNVYFDEENRRHLNSMRLAFSQVAQALAIEGKRDSAQQLLRKFDAETNEKNFPYGMTSNRGNQHNYFSYLFLQACYASGELKLANKVSVSLLKDLKQAVAYYKSLGEAMSDDQFFVNAENAYQGKPNSLVNKQIAFVQDILTCGQLIEAVNKMEKDFTVAKN
ncbi:MAG: DUF2723 domain-containing protein [Sediminibacterium sp.]|jgi:hypothetical protein|nr:DUF2723 domain-containing protein [Sediminibacterium sp.]